MKLIEWKKHVFKPEKPGTATIVYCPSCGTKVEWDTSWEEQETVFYCSECGCYAYRGRSISGEEAERLTGSG
jgi:hypothetical protein